jgi:hypothetical protein
MPDFEATLLRKVNQEKVLSARSRNQGNTAHVLGGLLYGGNRPQGRIRWLAVRFSARRNGIGQCLIEGAIEFTTFDHISVDTFRNDNVGPCRSRSL